MNWPEIPYWKRLAYIFFPYLVALSIIKFMIFGDPFNKIEMIKTIVGSLLFSLLFALTLKYMRRVK